MSFPWDFQTLEELFLLLQTLIKFLNQNSLFYCTHGMKALKGSSAIQSLTTTEEDILENEFKSSLRFLETSFPVDI